MGNRYQPLSEYGRAVYGDDVVELELSAVEERDLVASGHLEVVPRTYRQLSRNYSAAAQGETFEAALPVELEAALVQGCHIERVDEPAPTSPAAKKASTTTRKKRS